jgi:hypothetical protein
MPSLAIRADDLDPVCGASVSTTGSGRNRDLADLFILLFDKEGSVFTLRACL